MEGNTFGDSGQYAPDVMLDAALDFIRRRRDEPFFLYFPSLVPHHEYQVPAESMEEYRGRFEEAPFIREDRGFVVQQEPAAAFAGMVTRLDEHVGLLLDELDAQGLTEDTLVIFTSDNGAAGSFQPLVGAFDGSGPLRGFKRDLYEGGIRVPFIARWAGKIPTGSSNAQPVAFWDLLPTFAELAGVEPPAEVDGVSIAPTLLGAAAAGREQQQHEFFYWETGGREQAVRMGRWKAVRHDPAGPLELYDLDIDMGERNDVAAANPEIVAKIEAYLETARTEPVQRPEPGWSKDRPPG